MAISSSVSRQSEVKPGQTTSVREFLLADAVAGELFDRRLGVGLQLFGATKARLKGNAVVVCRQLQCFSQQAPGLLAFAEIRVAQVQRAFRQAV